VTSHLFKWRPATILWIISPLFQGQLGSTQNQGLIPCVLLVLKEMLPTYHKWRYNTYGVRERIGEGTRLQL